MLTLPEILQLSIATGTGGLGVGMGIYAAKEIGRAVGWLLMFKTGRQDKILAQIDEATKSLIETLSAEVKRVSERLVVVEQELEECKHHRDELERERAQDRGYREGQGDARQHAALIVAEEKRKEREQ